VNTVSAERINCINLRCRRTAPADKYEPGEEIICGKCFRALPMELRARYRKVQGDHRRMLRLIDRRLTMGTLPQHVFERLRSNMVGRSAEIWREIKQRFIAPQTPAGIENFLREVGLS
jgi:hypothetical protein